MLNEPSKEPSLDEVVTSLSKAVVYLIKDITATRKTLSEGLNKIDDNFKEINKKIDALSKDTGENFVDVHMNLKSIKSEITKINKVTGYEETMKNLSIVHGKSTNK